VTPIATGTYCVASASGATTAVASLTATGGNGWLMFVDQGGNSGCQQGTAFTVRVRDFQGNPVNSGFYIAFY
jgi:hypothetical protein